MARRVASLYLYSYVLDFPFGRGRSLIARQVDAHMIFIHEVLDDLHDAVRQGQSHKKQLPLALTLLHVLLEEKARVIVRVRVQ